MEYTSSMATAKVEYKEKTDTNNNKSVRNVEERNMGSKEKSSEQG